MKRIKSDRNVNHIARKPIKSVYDKNTFGLVEDAANALKTSLKNVDIKVENEYDDYFEDVRCKVLSTENLNPMKVGSLNDIINNYMSENPDIAIENEVNDYFYGRNIYIMLANEYYIDSSRKLIKSKKYYGELATDDSVTSGCNGKKPKERKAKKSLKSELDMQEFKEGLIRAGYTEEEANSIIEKSQTTSDELPLMNSRKLIKSNRWKEFDEEKDVWNKAVEEVEKNSHNDYW